MTPVPPGIKSCDTLMSLYKIWTWIWLLHVIPDHSLSCSVLTQSIKEHVHLSCIEGGFVTDRIALQGDNALGSVNPSVHLSVCALTAEPFDL